MSFHVHRRLVTVASLVLLLIISEVPHAAEEIFPVYTTWLIRDAAYPVCVIAAPSQAKKPPRPVNLPISSLRKTAPASATGNIDLPFTMSAPQALKIGNALVSDGDYATALPYFQDAHKQQPSSFDALAGLAECYYEVRRDDEALAAYKEVVGQNPLVWKAHFNLGRIHLEHARFAEASAAFTEADKIKPGDADTMSGLGVALMKQGRSAEAVPYLTQVTDLRRYTPEAFYNLGEAYANENQWLQAAEAFKTGADIKGIEPDAYSNWATMLYNADRLDDAVEAYGKVKKLDLTHLESAIYLADALKRLGKPVAAQGYYREVLRQRPEDIDSLVNLAYLCVRLNEWTEAEKLYKKLIGIDPKHADALTNLAALQSWNNEIKAKTMAPTQGITLLGVVSANPNDAEAHINLGSQLITEKSYREAVDVLQKAVSLTPDSAAAHFNLGLAQLKVGDHENAVASNRKALQIKPEWAEAYYDMGLAYAGLNKWDDAAKAYAEAIRINPKYAGARYYLGIAYMKMGQKALALQQVEGLKPLSRDLPDQLAYEIHKMELATRVIPAETSTPPSLATSAPSSVSADDPGQLPTATAEATERGSGKPAAGDDCPGPIYRPTDVTQMAHITGKLQASYTDEARRNKVEGRMVLQAVLCANGRVSDITVEEPLSSGLTEQAIVAMTKVQFQPALMDGKPVSVMIKQEFVCDRSSCKATTPP